MSYADRDGVIWMDGKMVPWRDAQVHVLTHTLHYGVGAFEGIRASKRHKSGIAVRFPRISRWRRDKPIREAATLEQVKALIEEE